MGNEETESRALVPIEEVEAELIFNPRVDKSLVSYGSRKIIRGSLINQLRNGYPIIGSDYTEAKPAIVSNRHEKSINNVLNVLNMGGVYTQKAIATKTGMSTVSISHILNELHESGLIDVSVYKGTYHYRIHE